MKSNRLLTPSYRLGNQVVIVRGKYSSALYDLYRGKIQRISNDLAEIMPEDGPITPVLAEVTRDSFEKVAKKLVERGFFEVDNQGQSERFFFGHSLPRFPPLRTISFELTGSTTAEHFAKYKSVILSATEDFSLGAFAFLIQPDFTLVDKLEILILELIDQTRFVLCELWCAEKLNWIIRLQESLEYTNRFVASSTCDQGDALPGLSETERNILGLDSRVSASTLLCRVDYYHLLLNYSESYGCLHFDVDFNTYPDVSERYFHVAINANDINLTELFVDKKINRYWKINKDARRKCKDCELRYACPNPLSQRSKKDDLGSSPGNCDYNLELGTW